MTNNIDILLSHLKDVYNSPGVPKKSYSVDYIANVLFEPYEITDEVKQKINDIITRKKDGRTETRVA